MAPGVAYRLISGLAVLQEERDELVRRHAGVERRDQRLHDARAAIVGAHIAPVLHVVRRRHVPRAARRGLVVIEREMDGERYTREPGGETSIGGNVVRRVAAEDD